MNRNIAWLAALLLATGCSRGSSPGSVEQTGPEPVIDQSAPSAQLSPGPTASPPAAPALSGDLQLGFTPSDAATLSTVRAVNVQLELVGVSTPSALRVEFLSPDGAHYQSMSPPLDHPVEVDPWKAQTFSFTLPVAGTFIQDRSMSGEWKVKAFLGASELAHAAFTLGK